MDFVKKNLQMELPWDGLGAAMKHAGDDDVGGRRGRADTEQARGENKDPNYENGEKIRKMKGDIVAAGGRSFYIYIYILL